MRGHGRVNSFNWYTLRNLLTPIDAIIPSSFFLIWYPQTFPNHCNEHFPGEI